MTHTTKAVELLTRMIATPSHSRQETAVADMLQHTIEYDYNLSTVAEVEALMKGSGNGRVQR